MVQAGYAWVYKRYCDKPFCAEWIAIEDKAKSSRIGLWKGPNPIAPWAEEKIRAVYEIEIC